MPSPQHAKPRLALLPLVLCLALATPAAAQGKNQELRELRERIAQLNREIEQAAEDRSEAADALKNSERRISDVNREIRQLRLRHNKANRQLAELQRNTQQTRAELARQQQLLTQLLRERYVQGSEDALKLLLNAQDPAAISRNLASFHYVGKARQDLILAYQDTLAQLQDVETKTQLQSEELLRLRDQQLAQKQLLVAEKAERQATLKQLSEQIRAQRREVGSLQRDEQRLARLVARLAQVAKASGKSNTPQRPSGEKVTRIADASLAGYAFTKLKGKLALPVGGDIIARFGQTREGGGPTWKGLFIRAPQGREVRAVGSGQVAFADWLRGFGNLLIIDHDDGYLSLYSNNESLYKQAGDSVRAGDAIASVGNTGGQEDTGLYFELRYLGRPFDPLSWLRRK